MRLPLLLLFSLLVGSVSGVFAQTTGGDRTETDTVDVFKEPEAVVQKKSEALAIASTLLLPGLGHKYIGEETSALSYLTAEAVLIVGAIFCEQHANRLFENSKVQAWTYAHTEGWAGADEKYWQNVGNYLDSKGYNNIQEYNRTPDGKYLDPVQQWAWADDSYRKEYRAQREYANGFHVASSFLIGAMVLDRVIAFVDVRTRMRQGKIVKSARIEVTPRISPDLSTAGITLNARF